MSTPPATAREHDAETLRRLPFALALLRIGVLFAIGLALWLLLR